MALYGYTYEINKPLHQITLPHSEVQRFDDMWVNTFPKHAEAYRMQLDLLSPPLDMDEDEKRHNVASRIRGHALHPENWDLCHVCHINEQMDKCII